MAIVTNPSPRQLTVLRHLPRVVEFLREQERERLTTAMKEAERSGQTEHVRHVQRRVNLAEQLLTILNDDMAEYLERKSTTATGVSQAP